MLSDLRVSSEYKNYFLYLGIYLAYYQLVFILFHIHHPVKRLK